MKKSLVTIAFGEHSIGLGTDGVWTASGEETLPIARIANTLSKEPWYEYRPSHGAFGPLLAHRVARRLGGKVTITETLREGKPPQDIIF